MLEPIIVAGFSVVLAGLLTGRSLRITPADPAAGIDPGVWTEGLGRVAGSIAAWMLAAGAMLFAAWWRRRGEIARASVAAFAAVVLVAGIALLAIHRLLSQQGEIGVAPYRLEIAPGVYLAAFGAPALAVLCASFVAMARATDR
jgi:hypothetical protein